MNKGRCNRCKELRTKTETGRFHSSGYAICVDESERCWLRNTCPPCRYGTQKRVRKRQSEAEGADVVLDPLTLRPCRICSRPLPKSRYFTHKECDDKVHASEGTGIYTAEDWGYGVGLGSHETLTFKISEMNLLGAT